MARKPLVHFTQRGHRFEIYKEAQADEFGYAGYVDGERSVVATRADMAARALILKHVTGWSSGSAVH